MGSSSFDYRCFWCGTTDWVSGGLEEHHVIRRSQGGHNMGTVFLCHTCHERATNDKLFEEKIKKIYDHIREVEGTDDENKPNAD
jgi:5-methylcytosine-specific restriction endonuclease McrA